MKKNDFLKMISDVLDDYFKNDIISTLREQQANMSIDFKSDGQKFISFSMDKQLNKKDFPKGLFPFFNKGEKYVCSICDYIIFSESDKKFFVLLIELKKGKDNTMRQLDAGECFANFVINTVNRVYNKNIQPEIRKISIRESGIKNKASKQKQRYIKYDENNFHTFGDSKFWLKKYLV